MIEKSFHLLRTNPALTTNVKVVVTSDQQLFLESYKANRTLTEERFNHFSINKDSYLFDEIPAFFSGVPAETGFLVKSDNDALTMYDNFANQFDDIYYSGAAWTEDVSYDEEYEYTAPLWVKEDKLPQGFIIFRLDGPGLDDGNNPYNFRSEILDKWKIVDYFDLTESSDLGTFLRKQTQHVFFPEAPMEINFNDLELSKISGIDYSSAGYVSKSIHLEEYYKKNTNIFNTEKQFTDFWKDFGVIFPNIFNLKFLFDDTPATDETLRRWSLNRYMGFYIDTIEAEKSVSPYQPFDLKKVPEEDLQQLTASEVSEIPYLLNNAFVRDVGGRRYSFDPIFGDWTSGKIYWIEWNGVFYQLERVENDQSTIIGNYLYKVISNVVIEYPVPDNITNPDLQEQYKKVLINEISTMKYQIQVLDKIESNNFIAKNVIQNTNSTFTTLGRIYQQYLVNGVLVWGFQIQLQAEVDNNLFDIPDYDEADLHWIEINDKKHVIKKYADNIPNVGGSFYIQSDRAIRITAKAEQTWINNGINTKEEEYYTYNNIENVPDKQSPIFYTISRASFTEIKDFDFDRVETQYSNYEYEKENEITETVEPKLYSEDSRIFSISMQKPVEINKRNFNNGILREYFSSNYETYQEFENHNNSNSYIRDNGTPIFFDEFDDYVDFKWSSVVNSEPYTIAGVTFNNDVEFYESKLPLYIYPTRIPVIDSSGEQAINPATGLKMWQKDFKDNYVYTGVSTPLEQSINVEREYYREENYKLLINDDPTETLQFIDFNDASDNNDIKLDLTFVDSAPMATSMTWSPYKKSTVNPNEEFDPNYIPVSSEYIASGDLWELVQGPTGDTISSILNKNQYVCKWGFKNSITTADYPYRLSFDLETGGTENRSPSSDIQIPYAVRQLRELDYFYRFDETAVNSYKNQTLHLKEQYFDIDKYLDGNYDYFSWMLRSDTLSSDGLKLTKKYSLFTYGDNNQPALTLFRGVLWGISDVNDIIYDEEYLEEGIEVVEDYLTTANPKYNDYKFSIVMGRKLSTFRVNSGDNDGDFGIDIYLNDKWKNICVFLYFESDFPITFTLPNDENIQITYNLETSEIDNLYLADQILDQDSDPNYWENGKIRLNGGAQIGDLRIRDLKLYNVLSILNDHNYDPVNGSGRKPVNYIHIYDDSSIEIFDSTTTDFTLDFKLPEEFPIKEHAFTTEYIHEKDLIVNNTLKNRIILDDDPNDPNGDPNYTSEGALVGSINDMNAWNGMHFARKFTEGNTSDPRELYYLDPTTDPVLKRYSGPYVPIFKDIELFRPTGYYAVTSSNLEDQEPILSNQNWKFYDDFSDGGDSGPVLENFGYISELMFSKVNSTGNILKMPEFEREDKRSMYPMVDEYGYDFNPRYIFQSTWDRNFYLESRKVEVPVNQYPDLAGYTTYLDGDISRMIIPDNKKFNIVADDFEFQNINVPPPLSGGDSIHLYAESSSLQYTGTLYKSDDLLSINDTDIVFNTTAGNYARIELNAISEPIKDFRLEIRFKITDLTNSNTPFCFAEDSANNNELMLFIQPSGRCDLWFDHVSNTVFSDGSIIEDEWYTFIIDRKNSNIVVTLNDVESTTTIQNQENDLYLNAGVIGQDMDSLWGSYDETQALQGVVSMFQFETPTSIEDIDVMNIVNDATIDVNNWIRGRSGTYSLEYDSTENAIKHTNPDHCYYEYDGFIRLEPGQTITMSVRAKSNLGQPSLKFYCGIRQYAGAINGVQGVGEFPGTIGNNGHNYFVANAETLTANYQTFTSTYTPEAGVTYVRPLILCNYNSGNPNSTPNIMFTKDFFCKITSGNQIKSELQILNVDLESDYSFSITNKETKQQKSYSSATPLLPDTDDLIDVVVSTRNRIGIISRGIIEYKSNLDNGSAFTLRSNYTPTGTNFASVEINSDISAGDIIFELQTNTRGTINFNARIESATVFDLDSFIKNANTFLGDDYNLTNAVLNGNNLKFTIISDVDDPAYNFELIEIRNAIENRAKRNVSESEIQVIQKNELGELTYVGQENVEVDGTTFKYYENKATREITIEFWIQSEGFNVQNETILYKGDLEDPNNWSWQIRRSGNSEQLEFVTNSYILADPNELVNINPETNGKYVDSLVTETSINDQLWHHCAFVFDGKNNQKRIYIDSVRDVISTHRRLNNLIIDPTADVENENWPIVIGAGYQNGTLNFNGSIDEMRIWNYARNETQIINNWQLKVTPSAYKDPYRSLIGYWQFDEQIAPQIFDISVAPYEITRNKLTTTTIVDDGKEIVTSTAVEYTQNETSYHDPSNISQTDANIEWFVSEAEINGVSDERYKISIPPKKVQKKAREIPIQTTQRSKYVVEFEVPPPAPPAPPEVPSAPPEPTQIAPVKQPAIPEKIRKFRKPVFFRRPTKVKKPKLIKLYPRKFASLSLNRIDAFSRKRKLLELKRDVDETAKLNERIQSIRLKPFQILNKRVRLNRNLNYERVKISNNRTNYVKTYKKFFYNPKSFLTRRVR